MLTNICCRKGHNFNLFSVQRCLRMGWKLSGDANDIVLAEEQLKIEFDIVVHTKKGGLLCVIMKRINQAKDKK